MTPTRSDLKQIGTANLSAIIATLGVLLLPFAETNGSAAENASAEVTKPDGIGFPTAPGTADYQRVGERVDFDSTPYLRLSVRFGF